MHQFMKPLFYALAFVSILLPEFANAQFRSSHAAQMQRGRFQQFADPANKRAAHNASKTTTVKYRLKTMASDEDTTIFTYSGSSGSHVYYDQWAVDFDQSLQYIRYASSGSYDKRKVVRSYDVNNNCITSLSQIVSTGGSTAWINEYLDSTNYNPANYPIYEIRRQWDTATGTWLDYSDYTYTYNSAGQHDTITRRWSLSGVLWRNMEKMVNTYNLSGDLSTNTSYQWADSPGVWVATGRTFYLYDISGDLNTQTDQYLNFPLGIWETGKQVIHTYDSMHHLTSRLTQQRSWLTGALADFSFETFSGYVSEYPSTTIYQEWNDSASDFINSDRIHYTYNPDLQLANMDVDFWNRDSNVWDLNAGNDYRFHYEAYNVETSVANNMVKAPELKLYPIPTKDVLHLEITWPEPQSFTVSITDVSGRIIDTWHVGECSRHTATVPVNILATGNYVIKMEGLRGKLSKRFVVN